MPSLFSIVGMRPDAQWGKRNRLPPTFFLNTSQARCMRVILIMLVVGIATAAPLEQVASASGRTHPAPALYFGLTYPETPNISTLNTYEREIGKNVSLVLWYQSWVESGQRQPFPTNDMEAVRQHGSIPVLAWEPHAYPSQSRDPMFSLTNIATGAWDDYIRQYAIAAKRWGHPFFLRFASEMNGSWVTWSEWANGNSAGQFIPMWRHVHDIFAAEGATNVTWVWCPNVDNGDAIPLKGLYPGDAYVDWLGLDGYNFGQALGVPWRSFAQVFQPTYTKLLALTSSPKPIMIGETGSIEAGGSKANWIMDALRVQLPEHFPRVRALIWFNMVDGDIDLRIETSPESLSAFRSAIRSSAYTANVYSTLSQYPIPPPVRDPDAQPDDAVPLSIQFELLARLSSKIAVWLRTLWGLTGLFAVLHIGFLSTLVLGVALDRVHKRGMQRRMLGARE